MNPEEIKEKITTVLGVHKNDLARCKSRDEEFTVILRQSSDLKNMSDPTEYGYASRIREINQAQRMLQQQHQTGLIHSFLELLKDDSDDDDSDKEEQSVE